MDEANQAALKTLLQEWINDRNLALRDQVLSAWREAQDRLVPDDAMVQRILAMAVPAPAPEPAPEPAPSTDADLAAGLDLLAQAATQGEVLKHLLDGIMRFGRRSALFVIKQGIASLYAHRGFDSDHPKLGAPVVPPPELERMARSIRGAELKIIPRAGHLAAFEQPEEVGRLLRDFLERHGR